MHVLTAGDHRFHALIQTSQERAIQFGYTFSAYDLGSLGIGEPFKISSQSFKQNGYYIEAAKGYLTRALHKPAIIQRGIKIATDMVLYLDGDALLLQDVDSVKEIPFDIALTLRPIGEITGHPELTGAINAGVLFLRPSIQVNRFVEAWTMKCEELQNDQWALNQLIFVDPTAAWERLGERRFSFNHTDKLEILPSLDITVHLLPGEEYNCYHFPLSENSPARILHFKDSVRDHFHHLREQEVL